MPFRLIPAAIAAAIALAFAALLPAQNPSVRAPEVSPPATTVKGPNAKDKQKLREGSKLEDIHGKFDFAGERMAFYPTGETESFRVLENLSLERIWQATQDSNRRDEWLVSGTVTEYRGANYLLVTKAVVRLQDAKSPNP